MQTSLPSYLSAPLQPKVSGRRCSIVRPPVISISRSFPLSSDLSAITMTIGGVDLQLPTNRPLTIGGTNSGADVIIRSPLFQARKLEITVLKDRKVQIAEIGLAEGKMLGSPTIVSLASGPQMSSFLLSDGRKVSFQLFCASSAPVNHFSLSPAFRSPVLSAINNTKGEEPRLTQWTAELFQIRDALKTAEVKRDRLLSIKWKALRPINWAFAGSFVLSVASSVVALAFLNLGLTEFTAWVNYSFGAGMLGCMLVLLGSMLVINRNTRRFHAADQNAMAIMDRLTATSSKIMTTLRLLPESAKTAYVSSLSNEAVRRYQQLTDGTFIRSILEVN